MHQKERIKCITDILKKNGYVSVKFLTDELHYSTATINRDLNVMQKQKLIKRSYGGVELIKTRAVPLMFRYHKMRPAKNKIAKKAAEFVCDGDVVFIDGSTTAQYMGKYITDRKNLTVITNNITLAAFLSEHGIEIICLGGRVAEVPSMLCSSITIENAKKYKADKMFFSVGAFSENGEYCVGELYYSLHMAVRENAKQAFLLIDHEKRNRDLQEYWIQLSEIYGIVTDYKFSDEVKEKYKNTQFIEVE